MGNHTATRARAGRSAAAPRTTRSDEERAVIRARRAYDVATHHERVARTPLAERDQAYAALRAASIALDRAQGGPGLFIDYRIPDARRALVATLGAANANSQVLARLTGAQPGDFVEVRPFYSPAAGEGVALFRGANDPVGAQDITPHGEVNMELSRLMLGAAQRTGLPPGTLVMHVPWVSTAQSTAQSGREIARSALEAARIGVARIYAEAAGPPLKGYYTWAVMGAHGRITGYTGFLARQTFGEHITTVQQVMAQPGGRQWWKEHGDSFQAEMDLTPGGTTRTFLEQVLKGRG